MGAAHSELASAHSELASFPATVARSASTHAAKAMPDAAQSNETASTPLVMPDAPDAAAVEMPDAPDAPDAAAVEMPDAYDAEAIDTMAAEAGATTQSSHESAASASPILFDDHLPPELLLAIASFLDGQSLARLSMCNRTLAACADSPALWAALVRDELQVYLMEYDNDDEPIGPRLLYERSRGFLAANQVTLPLPLILTLNLILIQTLKLPWLPRREPGELHCHRVRHRLPPNAPPNATECRSVPLSAAECR